MLFRSIKGKEERREIQIDGRLNINNSVISSLVLVVLVLAIKFGKFVWQAAVVAPLTTDVIRINNYMIPQIHCW